MSYKKFGKNDIFKNTLKTNPHYEFKIYAGKVYLNDSQDGYARLYGGLDESLVAGCELPNSFDLSCEDNTFNIALI